MHSVDSFRAYPGRVSFTSKSNQHAGNFNMSLRETKKVVMYPQMLHSPYLSLVFVTTDRQQMQALVCLAELEGLHIQQTASAFDKCNKEGLVRGLWRNHKHERKVCLFA